MKTKSLFAVTMGIKSVMRAAGLRDEIYELGG